MSSLQMKVGHLHTPKRADAYLAEVFAGKFSREELKASLVTGGICVNGQKARPSLLLKEGDVIAGTLPEQGKTAMVGEDIPLKVLYEDKSLLVIDKPVGMVVHPGAGNKKSTLVHALIGRGSPLSNLGGDYRPGIVHRLDKDTSGLLIVAKNNEAHRGLQSQFAARAMTKIYTALVKGRIQFEEGHVNASIDRHSKIRQKMAVSEKDTAREAETLYRTVERFRYATLLEVRIVTGRTHQIRVHMAHIGHPVVGDPLYGTALEGQRLALHATKIEFIHPLTDKSMKFESPLPADLQEMIRQARDAKAK